MPNDIPMPGGQGGGQQAVPGAGGGGQGGDAMTQLMQYLLRGGTHPSMPQVKPEGMGKQIEVQAAGMIPIVGKAVQAAIKQQRDYQINEVSGKVRTLISKWEVALYAANGDKQKATQIYDSDPEVKAIWQDKKFQKGMGKVFGADLLNPEKQNTVFHEGFKKGLQLHEAEKKLKQAHGKMQDAQAKSQQQPPQGQPQGAQGQPQGGGMQQPSDFISKLPQEPQLPKASDIESISKIQQQKSEFETRQAEVHQQHQDSLAIQKQNLDLHRDQMEQSHQDRMAQLEEKKQRDQDIKAYEKDSNAERARHDREMEVLRSEQISTQKEIALDRLAQTKAGKGLKPEYKAGLKAATVSMFGSEDGKSKGEIDMLAVFDDPASRKRLTAAIDLYGNQPDSAGERVLGVPIPTQWRAFKQMAESDMLTPQEREWVRYHNRTISAINALRSVTGLPRATQQLMERYILELPNPAMDTSSVEAMDKLQLVQREINAALSGAGEGGSEEAAPASDFDPEKEGGKKVTPK